MFIVPNKQIILLGIQFFNGPETKCYSHIQNDFKVQL